MRCDEADPLLDAFAEDALDADERAAVGAHVAACARCRGAVEASLRLGAAIAALPAPGPSSATDARVLAAIAEDRAWQRARARTRRAVVAVAAGAVLAGAAAVVAVTGPAGQWAGERLACLAHAAELWLTYRAAPEIAGSAPSILAAVVACAVLVAADRAMAAPAPRHRPASA